jgi:hypothetical protein
MFAHGFTAEDARIDGDGTVEIGRYVHRLTPEFPDREIGCMEPTCAHAARVMLSSIYRTARGRTVMQSNLFCEGHAQQEWDRDLPIEAGIVAGQDARRAK